MNVHGINFRSISMQSVSPFPVRDGFCSSGSVDTVTLSGNISQCSDAGIDRLENDREHRNADSLKAKAEIALSDRQVSLRWQVRDVMEAVCGKDGMIYTVGKDTFKSTDSNGNTGFQNPLDSPVYSPLLAAKSGAIVMSNRAGSLIAMDSSGKQSWRSDPETGFYHIESESESRDGTIYLMDSNHTLYSVDPSSGSLKWKFKTRNGPCNTGSEIYSIPREGPDGTIYIGSHNCHIYAISPDGNLKWRYKTKEWVNGTAAFSPDGNTVYMGSCDGILRAFNASGDLLWESKRMGALEGEPAVGQDGTIYFGSADTYFRAYNPDGTEKWKFKTGKYMQCSPMISRDGTIYAGGNDGYLYAFNSDGGLLWKHDVKSPVKKITGGDENGRIYVLTDDRRLIALDTDVRSVQQKISDSEKAIQDTKSEIIASDDWLIIGGIRLQIKNERSGKAA